jgi:hypothetical protein
VGYRQPVDRIVVVRGEAKAINVTVQHPPDTQACIFWLRNRCRPNWNGRPAAVAVEDAEKTAALLATLDAAGERARQAGD